MIACSLAIFCVPKESTMVTIELKASGIAATARATAKRKASPGASPLKILIPNRMAQKIMINIESFFPKSSRFTWSGVLFSDVFFRRLAIFPTSVPIPMPVTSYAPRPYVTKLPENTRFVWSPRAAPSGTSSRDFSTDKLSPVSALSSTFRLAHSTSFPSAGTQSPASRITRSPIVTSLDGICFNTPSRMTFASGADICFRLSRDCSAFKVCTVPRIAFIVITTRITIALSKSPRNPDTIAAMISIMTRKSLYCSRKICSVLFFFPSTSSLKPYFS